LSKNVKNLKIVRSQRQTIPGWLQAILNAHRPIKPNNSPIRFEPNVTDNVVIYRDAMVFCKQSERFPGLVKAEILVGDVMRDVEW
jgi:hypothetical protein